MFVVSLAIADLLLIVRDQNKLRQKLLVEWLLLSCPFIYWGIKYGEWIFAVAIITFFYNSAFTRKANAVTTGPYTQFPGDNNDRAMMSANFSVTIDNKARLTGVKQGNTSYTVAEWNDMNRQKSTSHP